MPKYTKTKNWEKNNWYQFFRERISSNDRVELSKFVDSLLSSQKQELIKKIEEMKKIVSEYIEFPITDSKEDEWRRKAIIVFGERMGYNQALSDVLKLLKDKS